MRLKLFCVSIFAAFGAAAVPAAAATITYDFTSNPVPVSTHEVNLTDVGSGLTLGVEAYSVFDEAGADTDGDIASATNGWGVAGSPGNAQIGGDEALALTFGSSVALTEITIRSGNNTQINVFDYMTETLIGTIDFVGSGFKTVDVTSFGLTGEGFVLQRGPGTTFLVSSVSVSAIPLPAGALLLLGGLGALGFARRRKA